MLVSIFRIIVLCLWCILWVSLQAAFVIAAVVLAGPVALIVSAASFTARGHFVTQIEWMALEFKLNELVHFLEHQVPNRILGRES